MNEIESVLMAENLPRHFTEFYPKFITLMKGYFDYLYAQGLTKGEVQDLLDDDSWITSDVEAFIKTGNSKYINFNTEDAKQQNIIEQSGKRIARIAEDVLADTNLEREFSDISTLDGEWFVAKPDGKFRSDDERPFMVREPLDDIIQQQYNRFFFPKTEDNLISDFTYKETNAGERVVDSDDKYIIFHDEDNPQYRPRTLDHIRMIKMLKHIHAIKGTRKGIELFFHLFTGIPLSDLIYPKDQLMVIDGVNEERNHIDGTSHLRDDYRYSEFSYIVKLVIDPEVYEFVFNEIYLRYFHPTGFVAFAEKA